ncbi:DNA-protecting protein DprA, partial [Cellulomonas septica]|nr:DNA-protecting protein DprA [Cellulomonas septica]
AAGAEAALTGALAVAAGVSVAEAHAALGLLELDGLVHREGAGWRRTRP